ncbi:hypothetical protein PACTADRAFT_48987 [Pachysolen tannophilus NRRL Y-2460]|uniref:G-protein coupled receptors family 1 profile domain-containing protein n=1 Tax=Pachysolen tannophilus NRRL Y-2460 TaxID=669874 RepID=A0A1E4TZP3_PACTA|nr:hypothetical protein PACTADRAFT_48987 [Pachysolen tannophilus NRRL Y-2460]
MMSPSSQGNPWAEYSMILMTKRDYQEDRRFDESQSHILRVCSISASCISILSGLVGFYMFGAIDHKKRAFRHQLIVFLIFFDFIKAVVFLIYPARAESKYFSYYNQNFCNFVGFFTSFSIEGADIAILSFAIHTGLLIFKPNFKVKIGNNVEGGLFRYRYLVYLISFLTPVLLASLAYIDGKGYEDLTIWCYLTHSPIWYRLVLSWVPRYLIIVVIVTIYCAIYFYVMQQYKSVGGTFSSIHIESENDQNDDEKNKFWKKFNKTCKTLKNAIFFADINFESDDEKIDIVPTNDDLSTTTRKAGALQKNIHRATYQQFQVRRAQIQKQMKSIFIYPISYIFLWSFPFILQCVEFHDPSNKVLWLNAVAAFFYPFNCTIDTLVFLYRERPWTITTSRIDTDPNEDYHYSKWSKSLQKLPLYELPTKESNRKKFINEEIENYRRKEERLAQQQQLQSQCTPSHSINQQQEQSNINPHDFSSILAGGDDLDFVRKPSLNSFKFNNNNINSNNVVTPRDNSYRTAFYGTPQSSAIKPLEFMDVSMSDGRRRKSSKLSWITGFTTGSEEKRSSTNTDVTTNNNIWDSRKKSIQSDLSSKSEKNSIKDGSSTNKDNTGIAEKQETVFLKNFAFQEPMHKALSDINEASPASPHDPHDPVSPTNPKIPNELQGDSDIESNGNNLETKQEINANYSPNFRRTSGVSGSSISTSHFGKSLSLALGLNTGSQSSSSNRRSSLFDMNHDNTNPNTNEKSSNGGHGHGFGYHSTKRQSHANSIHDPFVEEDSQEEEEDIMDILRKGPPRV